MLTLRDAMSIEPATVSIDTAVEVAAARYFQRPSQPLLVVDAVGALVGMIGEVALLRAPSDVVTCGELVDRVPAVVDADTPLLHAMELRRKQPDGVLVATSKGRPVGVLTSLDIVRLAQHLLPAHMTAADLPMPTAIAQVDIASTPAVAMQRLAEAEATMAVVSRNGMPVAVVAHEELAWARRFGAARVELPFRRTVFPACTDASLRRVSHDLLRTRARALPVVGPDHALVGIITAEDIASAVHSALDALPRTAVA